MSSRIGQIFFALSAFLILAATPAMAQGPEFWVVDGLSRGDTLNVRSGPSTKDSVVGTLSDGVVVENYGCR